MLGARGVSVAINYARSYQTAERLAEEIRAKGGRAIAVGGDVTRSPAMIFDDVRVAFGDPDFVISNAGGVSAFSEVSACPEALFDETSTLNARAAFLVLREAARCTRSGGRIVGLSSSSVVVPPVANGVYAGAKAAVAMYCAVLAEEVRARGVTVNAVLPGLTLTEGVQALNLSEARLALSRDNTPLCRLANVDDVAAAVLMLLSQDAGGITGQAIHAGGGAF